MRKPPAMKEPPIAAPEMRHFKSGSLICVGYVGSDLRKGSIWAARCDCGEYVLRTTRAMKNWTGADPDCCPECVKQRTAKRKDAAEALRQEIMLEARDIIADAIAEHLNGAREDWNVYLADKVMDELRAEKFFIGHDSYQARIMRASAGADAP
jgi:hypothetical protein